MGAKLNGLDVEAYKKTCEQIKKDPSLAKSQFRLHNTWENGGHNKIKVEGYYTAGQEFKRKTPFEFNADEPPVMFGKDHGANPVEYLLTALSGCMTTTIIYHASEHGYTIDSLNSDFKGNLDIQGFLDLSKDVPVGYKEIEAEFHIKTDAPTEELEKYIHFSPVYSMVSKAVPINVTFVKE